VIVRRTYIVPCYALALLACSTEEPSLPIPADGLEQMTLESSAFEDGAAIPKIYTCDGDGVSPPLSWSEVPEGTKSFALVLDDPDAPREVYEHWVVWNIPSDWTELPEDVRPEDDPPSQGENDAGKTGYTGPCPPKAHDDHHYEFHLFAADIELDLPSDTHRDPLYRSLDYHVLGMGELTGKYDR